MTTKWRKKVISKETEGSALILKQPNPPPEVIPFFEAGGTTFHRHTCPVGPHIWDCNSPYCSTLTDNCPDHGGDSPVKIGREPWRR